MSVPVNSLRASSACASRVRPAVGVPSPARGAAPLHRQGKVSGPDAPCPDVHGTGRATGPKSSGSRARTTPPWVRRARKTSTRCPGRTTRRCASAGTSSRGTSDGASSVPGSSTITASTSRTIRRRWRSIAIRPCSRAVESSTRHRRDEDPWRPRFTLRFARAGRRRDDHARSPHDLLDIDVVGPGTRSRDGRGSAGGAAASADGIRVGGWASHG